MKKILVLTVLVLVLGMSTICSAFEVSVGTPVKDGGYHSGEFHSVELRTLPAKDGKRVAVAKTEQDAQKNTAKQ